MYGGKGVYRVVVGKPVGKNHLEDPGVDDRIILRWIFRKCVGGMDCIVLAQDMDRWRALLNSKRVQIYIYAPSGLSWTVRG